MTTRLRTCESCNNFDGYGPNGEQRCRVAADGRLPTSTRYLCTAHMETRDSRNMLHGKKEDCECWTLLMPRAHR